MAKGWALTEGWKCTPPPAASARGWRWAAGRRRRCRWAPASSHTCRSRRAPAARSHRSGGGLEERGPGYASCEWLHRVHALDPRQLIHCPTRPSATQSVSKDTLGRGEPAQHLEDQALKMQCLGSPIKSPFIIPQFKMQPSGSHHCAQPLNAYYSPALIPLHVA